MAVRAGHRCQVGLYLAELQFASEQRRRLAAAVSKLRRAGYPTVVDSLVAVGMQRQPLRIHTSLLSFTTDSADAAEHVADLARATVSSGRLRLTTVGHFAAEHNPTIKRPLIFVTAQPDPGLTQSRHDLLQAATAAGAAVTEASLRPWIPHVSLCTKTTPVDSDDIALVETALEAAGVGLPVEIPVGPVIVSNIETGARIGDHGPTMVP